MTIPANADSSITCDLAGISARVLDDAHMNWIAAEVDSEHALRGWYEAAASDRTAADPVSWALAIRTRALPTRSSPATGHSPPAVWLREVSGRRLRVG